MGPSDLYVNEPPGDSDATVQEPLPLRITPVYAADISPLLCPYSSWQRWDKKEEGQPASFLNI